MIGIWVMSKSYESPAGILPIAWSYGFNHKAMGYDPATGWGLVWLTCEAQQIAFMQSNTDPNVQYVGTMWDAPTPLVLQVYAGQLGSGTYTQMTQVLSKLSQTEPRFLEAMMSDPNKP